jgi:biotin carboxyl carrier protein
MKYQAEINGRQVSVELEQRNGKVFATIDRRSYDLEIETPEAGVYLFFLDDEVHEARVWPAERDTVRVELGSASFSVGIIDRKHRRSADHHGPEGPQQLIAPMPGKVIRILLRPGDEVYAGQGVVVVEAMKMQNEIKSPKAGRLLEVRVSEGESVTNKQILAVVE